MAYEPLFSLIVSLGFSLAPVALFFRAARAAPRSGGTSGNQGARNVPPPDAAQPTEPPVPAGAGSAAKARNTAKTKDAVGVDWHLILLDDETIAVLERKLDAHVRPPDAPDAIPPTDHSTTGRTGSPDPATRPDRRTRSQLAVAKHPLVIYSSEA